MSRATIRLAQIGGAYLGVAVLALETYNALTAPLSLASWIFWLVVLTLASGLPITLVVAIRFIKDDPEIEADAWMVRAPGALLAGTVVLVLAGGGSIGWWVVAGETGPRSLEQGSVAVLPFENQSPDPADGYFAEGLTDELTRVFTQVPGVKVMIWDAREQEKAADAGTVETALRMGAGALLEGTVRKAGNRIRVTAELVNTEDRVVLWSGKYDRDLTDIFAVQDEISAAIVKELTPTVARSKAAPTFDWGTRDPTAYVHYLQGRSLMEGGDPGNREEAVEAFRRALEADPDFDAARTALAALTG